MQTQERSKHSSVPGLTAGDERWASIVARNKEADGTFVYSVRTTGVYCRPSCASRLARPENVRFHGTCAEAEQAGFRPCKRCRPDRAQPQEDGIAAVAAACRSLQTDGEVPSLEKLARDAGLSTFHFHRLFKKIVGLTPKAYAAAYRAGLLRSVLPHSPSVTDAVYAAGYSSAGRFYARADQMLGMSPSHFRAKGAEMDIRFAVAECFLGAILVAQSERGICAVLLGDDPASLVQDLQERFARANLQPGDEQFESVVAQVVAFIEKPSQTFDLPVDIRGTAFQARVWQALQDIPAGSTASYSDVAQRMGTPSSTRAVAQACAANPLAVLVPCHRVVRVDGGLSGYRWGVERKRALLQREQEGGSDGL
jgi:AraC family transcriptional regulator of adaptative response/methylated-DNA-[protein]-cysteine methyltransferase